MPDNAELLVGLFEAFAQRDLAAIEAALAPNVRSHTSGANLLAGTANGRDAVLAQLGRSGELTRGSYRIEVEDVMGGEHHACVLYRATGSRRGRNLDLRHLALYRIEDGLVAEIWFTPLDQAAFDEFWSEP